MEEFQPARCTHNLQPDLLESFPADACPDITDQFGCGHSAEFRGGRGEEVPDKLIITIASQPRGVGVLGIIFAGYVLLASQSPYPIIVYSVANYRPHLKDFWANM